MGGEVQTLFDSGGSLLPLVKAGKMARSPCPLRDRDPALPNVPTVAEQGVPDFQVYAWNAVLAPRGTPAPIVRTLTDAFAQAGDSKIVASSPWRPHRTIRYRCKPPTWAASSKAKSPAGARPWPPRAYPQARIRQTPMQNPTPSPMQIPSCPPDIPSSTRQDDAGGPTRRLAAFASQLRFDDIPPALIAQIRLHVLDGIGVCLHGASPALDPRASPTWSWRRAATRLPAYGGTAAPLARATSVSQAVLVNATAGHAFEMDDIHKESILHPNSPAVPGALASAETLPGASGRDVLTAIVAGYEIGTRAGNAATTALFLNGFHPQGVTGTFVAAATAGRLLGLDADAMTACAWHRGLAGVGTDGGAGRRHGQAPARRPGSAKRRLCRVPGPARRLPASKTYWKRSTAAFLAATRARRACRALTDGLGTQWGGRPGRLQDVPQRHQHARRTGCLPTTCAAPMACEPTISNASKWAAAA